VVDRLLLFIGRRLGVFFGRLVALAGLLLVFLVVRGVVVGRLFVASAFLVFGWRLDFKHRLLRARAALARDDPGAALDIASALAEAATAVGVPRYSSVARLLVHRARARLGEPVDLDAVQADLDATRTSVALEAWWWIGDSAAAHGVRRWVDDAADAVASLARESGDHAAGLERASATRLDAWRAATG